MKASISATLLGVSPNPVRPNQEPSATAQVLVDGARGQELKKIKVPFAEMLELSKSIGEVMDLELDINEYSITDDVTGKQKSGVSYKLWADAKK